MKKDLNFDGGKSPKEFEHLFKFKSMSEKIKHMSRMAGFRILHEIETVCEKRKMSHKELAIEMEISEPYLSQVFQGEKAVNMVFIARAELALDCKFWYQLVSFEDFTKLINQRIWNTELIVGTMVGIKGDSRIGTLIKLGKKRSQVKLAHSTLTCDTKDIYKI